MIPVLTKSEAYRLDKDTIASGCLSQEELMDNAGKAIAQFFCEKIKNPFSKTVVVVCGRGNNGGDGIIAHYYLKKYNISSKIVFTESIHGQSKLLEKYKISKIEYSIYNDKTNFDKYDWIIDGIFGIGLSRKLNNRYRNLITKINCFNIISIDMPSGVSDSLDETVVVNSKYTITFGFSKLSHYMNPINNIKISDIGFQKLNKSYINKIDQCDVKKILNPICLKKNIHKKETQCNIIAGSIHYPGAAFLCSMAANKAGSGYVSLYTDSENNLIQNLQSLMPEVIVKDLDLFDYNAISLPTLIGPGGQLIPTSETLDKTASYVIDASALSDFDDFESTIENDLARIPKHSIMTPHTGEFKIFFKLHKNKKINVNDFKRIQKLIGSRIVILKSFNTFIITADMIYIVNNGSSLLATAGTGDVLSGILISLLSQGYSRLEASILGTYLHGEAANYYMNNISKDGMTALDLIDCIPHAFNKLRTND